MSTQNEYGYRFFPSIVIGGCIVAILLLVYAIFYGEIATTVPTQSYQEKNQEVLKAAKPNDLILCVNVDDGKKLERVVLVEQNDGHRILGYEINHHAVRYITNGGYTYSMFNNCRVIEVSQTFAPDNIGRIVMFGVLWQPYAK